MTKPLILRVPQDIHSQIGIHLFPGDADEHGGVLKVGIADSPRSTRLLAREFVPAIDGVDYVPGKRGYRALTADFVARVSDECARENLGYLAVHCHQGRDQASFSVDDMLSHERGYPALLDITDGPVGGLVFAENAVAGDVWFKDKRVPLHHAVVVGPQVRALFPLPPDRPAHMAPMYDRHASLIGDAGQAALSALKVGIVGLGGGGSLLNEWLSRLGVGHIVAIDFDRIDITNLPRITGATRSDARTLLTGRSSPILRRLGKRIATPKVKVARRVAHQANGRIAYDAIEGDILDAAVAGKLTDCDFIFLATDNIASRLVFNAVLHQYLIPGAQVGVKVVADRQSGEIRDITCATRLVFPHPGGGCLHCNGWIPSARLQDEAEGEDELRARGYIDGASVAAPSVITLNALSAAEAANDVMMLFTGLYDPGTEFFHRIYDAQVRMPRQVELVYPTSCLMCSRGTGSDYARGERASLPCRC